MDEEMAQRSEEERPPVAGRAPWLVYPCEKRRENQLFCTISPLNAEIKSIPEMRETEIWACVDGWLLLHGTEDESDLMVLWNPVTSESIKLPSLPHKLAKTLGDKIFTSSPSKPGCTVLLFDMHRPIIRHSRPGDEKWSLFDWEAEILDFWDSDDEDDELHFGKAGCVGGVVYTYASGYTSRMVAIEVEDENGIGLRGLGVDLPSSRNYSPNQWAHFVESCGELYYVEICDQGTFQTQVIGLEIFRLDLSGKAWVKVESLKDRSFFLSQRGCTSCLAEEIGGKGNLIHFILPEDNHLYTYDLGDGTVLTSFPCESLDLETPLFRPSWVKPNYYSRPDIQAGAEEAAVGEEEGPIAEQMETDEPAVQNALHPFLQMDTLESVAKRLTVLDYLHFRAACKLFRSVAPPVEWRTKPMISWDMQFPYPMLVTFRSNQSVMSLVDPKNHETYSMNIPESLRGTIICCSKDGYLLLADHTSLFYFNPFTKKQGQLPTSNNPLLGLTFTSIPPSSDCLVLQIWGDKTSVAVDFIRSGDENWSFLQWIHTNAEFVPNFNAPVYSDGSVYCLDQKGHLGTFEIEEDGTVWRPSDLETPCYASHHNYLAQCRRGLLAVFVGHNGSWVKVFRLTQRGWVRVRHLGKSMLFVSRPSSFAATSKVPEMQNKVYFPRFHRGGIVYYSLETDKFHTRGNNEEIVDFTGTKEQLHCAWIEPRGE